ncbi:MAG: hypothetical protein ACYCXF_02090 [Thermoleophilia bacterium]
MLIFLSMGILQKDQATGNLVAIAIFSLLIVPVISLRLCKSAATARCRYILAAGIGRSTYLLAVAIASLLITTVLLLITLAAATLKSPEMLGTGFLVSFLLLLALVVVNTFVCVLFSRLLVGRWGTGTAILLIIIAALADQNSFNQPLTKSIVGALHLILPWSNRAIAKISESSTSDNWLVIFGQLSIYIILIGFVAIHVFRKKELVFEEE